MCNNFCSLSHNAKQNIPINLDTAPSIPQHSIAARMISVSDSPRQDLELFSSSSLLVLVDDDNFYENYMIEKFYYFYKTAPENAYSFYVHPLDNFPIGQGADGFAINTNSLKGIKVFYDEVVKDYKELFLYDDLWISYFLFFFRENKILSLQEYLKRDKDGKSSLIYKTHIIAKGLISTYGENLIESVKKRDQIAKESFKYMKEKTKNLTF